MFKKRKQLDTRRSASGAGSARRKRRGGLSIIGPTVIFEGELSAEEDLVIEGKIEGTIAHHKKNLTIGPQGRVKAEIHADSVVIEGKMRGDVHAGVLVLLTESAEMWGNIFAPRVHVQDGAMLNGLIDMGGTRPRRTLAPDLPAAERTGT